MCTCIVECVRLNSTSARMPQEADRLLRHGVALGILTGPCHARIMDITRDKVGGKLRANTV